MTLNFPHKSKLKLNYIISSEQKDLSLFVKDAKEKKISIKKDNIFGFFNDKSEEKNKNIFEEMDSEEGEEEDESVKSNESESENIDEEDNYFFLKYRQPPKMKRSKSFHHKKITELNIKNISNISKKENNANNGTKLNKDDMNIKNKNNKDDLIDQDQEDNKTIPRVNTIYMKGQNNNIINNNIYHLNENEIQPKETTLKPSKLDSIKSQDEIKNNNNSTFCNGFLVVSFPYNNGKIIENSKSYRSMCGHLICSKLPAMESVIIYKYPLEDSKNLELNNFCASICFPTGIKVCYNQDRRTTYKSFCTNIINHKGDKFYMTVFHFYHKMDTLTYSKKYSDNSLKNYLRKFGDNIYHTEEEKEKLEKDLEECQELGFREFVFIPYALAIISKYPYVNQMKEILNNIFRVITNYEGILDDKDSIEKSIINDLISYIVDGIPVPIPNSCIMFNMPFNNKKIKIESPYNNNIRNIQKINYINLFKYFSIENIIIIYRLMLFEQKILFVDKDYSRLCSIIQSFIDLLYPIEWVNTLIPIMSEQMTRYLQTFLPFINGISEDLLNNNALNALKEAEEGVYEIFIVKGTIEISKDIIEEKYSGIPKLPGEIHKKLFHELKNLKELCDKLNKNELELYFENINNIFKNIFLESCSIMLYDLMDFIFNIENNYNYTIFDFDAIISRKKKDEEFYKELSDTQNFQNFIQNMINNKNSFALFINTIKNVQEKYIINNDRNKGVKWKSCIERKIQLKDIRNKTALFNLPNHLIKSSLDNTIKNIFIINKDSWDDLNKSKNDNNNITKNNNNKFISESNRNANYMTIIDNSLYKSENEIERYILPEEINKEYKYELEKEKPTKTKNINININLNKHVLRNGFNLSEEEKEKMRDNLKKAISSLLKNETNIPIDNCLTYVYYSTGRNYLIKLIYKKGFKVVKKIKEECFMSLNKICLNALIAICNINENEETLDFSVKLTQAAFCFCKENDNNLFLIDELRNKLGKDYFMWIKISFWNTWQNIENYFSINEYRSYCDVIKYDFVFKLLRLKIDKEFILNYLKYSLEEKMNLLLDDEKTHDDTIKKYNEMYNDTKNDLIQIIDGFQY